MAPPPEIPPLPAGAPQGGEPVQIRHQFDEEQQRLELQITGPVPPEETCSILRYITGEIVHTEYRELVLDLRQALFTFIDTQDHFQALLHTFIATVLEKGIRVTMLFTQEETEQWLALNSVRPNGGINVRYGTLRQAVWPAAFRDKGTTYQGCQDPGPDQHQIAQSLGML